MISFIAAGGDGAAESKRSEAQRAVVPLPPLAEQRRIVAKVDQLMALVDELETQLAASRTAAEKLMEAVIAELTGKNFARTGGVMKLTWVWIKGFKNVQECED